MTRSLKLLQKEYPELELVLSLKNKDLFLSGKKTPDHLRGTGTFAYVGNKLGLSIAISSEDTPEIRKYHLVAYKEIILFIGGRRSNYDGWGIKPKEPLNPEEYRIIEKLFIENKLNQNVKTI